MQPQALGGSPSKEINDRVRKLKITQLYDLMINQKDYGSTCMQTGARISTYSCVHSGNDWNYEFHLPLLFHRLTPQRGEKRQRKRQLYNLTTAPQPVYVSDWGFNV